MPPLKSLSSWTTAAGRVDIYREENQWKAALTDKNGEKSYAAQIIFKDYRPDAESAKEAQDYFKEARVSWLKEDLTNTLEIRLRGLLGGGCVPSKTVQWKNHLGNVVVHPDKIMAPTSLSELLKVFEDNEPVKAVGSGHSYNPICDTSGTLVRTDRLCHIANDEAPLAGQLSALDLLPLYSKHLLVNPSICPKIPFAFVEIEAGLSIKSLVEHLDSRGLAAYNLGGANVQTVAGAFSTSTHGSGAKLGPLHSCVRSLVLCSDSPLFDNQPKDQKTYLYRIEPTKGFTDPDKYQHKAIRLVQDDQIFNTVNVSMGCCGIIYSYVLEVVPAYELAEYRKIDTWDTLKNQLQQDEKHPKKLPHLLDKNRHFEFLINPYQNKNQNQKALVTTRNIWDKEHPAYSGPVTEERNFLTKMSQCEWITGLFADWIHSHPYLIPAVLDSSLDSLANPETPYVAKSYEVFNMGSNSNAGFAFEVIFPLTDAAGNYHPTLLFKALDRLFELAAINAKAGRYQTAPLCVRYIKGDPAYLSMMNEDQEGKTLFAAIEILMMNSTDKDQDNADLLLLEGLEKEMHTLGGRVHWGLDAIVNLNKLQNFPETSVRKWGEVQRKLNAKGTFSNHMTDLLFANPL